MGPPDEAKFKSTEAGKYISPCGANDGSAAA